MGYHPELSMTGEVAVNTMIGFVLSSLSSGQLDASSLSKQHIAGMYARI